MKKILFSAIVVLLFVTAFYYLGHPLQSTVTIRGTRFFVDVAITPKEKELGLGKRLSLPADHGMLFPYDHKETYSFWMKDMHFPIDILWLDDKEIVDITKNVPAPSTPGEKLPIYKPRIPVNTVLELPAGTADRLGIIVRDKIEINK